MSKKISVRQAFPLLGSSLSCLFTNPKIFYPFAILAFLQLLLMLILFFSIRFPLSMFFGPIIARLRGAVYLHYPMNFDLMNHWFQSAQAVIFLFATSFFIAKAVLIVAKINQGEPLGETMPKLGIKKYVNLIAAFLLIFLIMYGMTSLYGILMQRAARIVSTSGVYYFIKQVVLSGAPYFNLFFSVIFTALFAYVVPLIVLEGKNVIAAVIKNFKLLLSGFWPLFVIIAVTSLFYLPVLLIRSNYQWFSTFIDPEGWQMFVILGVFVMLFIDAVQYTAVTLCYFLTKDE